MGSVHLLFCGEQYGGSHLSIIPLEDFQGYDDPDGRVYENPDKRTL